ncbi:glycosyl transferase [Listeria newyorkensis]|uniref:Glycosyl transferase n=1 Tax=Listeria newyorkensis TaxID=1497681 RepID=A0ABX4XJZ1_9LIST|nr:glycosyltransferase family 4 protein [Listeria newyorkensis]KGL45577.1 glycosyl transferase [Listeria newyorkensis]PNP89380.1 glycosyl transferase [Listeria newyorkensis]WAO22952.1 glycosyltransferase family 4 protein [Listeria newyorkensis]SQC57225.1 GDP-mannose-dependent alpha-(1-2)-phosphatidylinositol mannosyltransferase [Listeria newyorkensis]
MRILMIGPDSEAKGGIATVIKNFKTYFQAEQQEIQYLTTWKEGSFFTRMKATIQSILQIKKTIRRDKIDVVHVHMAQQGSFFRKSLLIWRARKECRIVLHMHASQFDIFYNNSKPLLQKYIRWILSQPDKVVVLSDEWADFYNKLTAVPVTVIENAVPMPLENTYDSDSKHIIMFGRIGKRKGSYDVLAVAKKMQDAYPDVQIYLYGDGETEEVRQEIVAKQLDNVILGGWIDSAAKEQILRDAVLHILPSYHEGLPMAILETMAHGIPNLSTYVGGIPQAIQDGVNGTLIEAGDTAQLEVRMIQFLSDREMRMRYSQAAFVTIQERFAMKPYQQKWEETYQNMMQ